MCPPVHPCSARSVLLPECVAVATPGGTGSDRRKPIPLLYCCGQVSSAFCRTRTRPRPVSTPLHRNPPYLRPPPPPGEVSWLFVLVRSMSFCVHALLDAWWAEVADPKCKAAELGFLLRAGWVVVGPLRGRGCSWCAPAGGARAKCGLEGVLHRDFWEHPSHLCPYSGGYLFFFLAPFDARPGPWLYLARVQLMGAHPHQQPATAGHTSTKTPAEIRKAMAVGLAVIAAGGHERRFFSGPPFTGGAWGAGGRSGLAHVAVLARKCHTRGALPAVVEVTI